MTAEEIYQAWDTLCTHGSGLCYTCGPRAIAVAQQYAKEERDAEVKALRDALRAVVDCLVNRSTVEGDLPWTSDVYAALTRATVLLAGQTSESRECGAIGERWVCVKLAGHAGLHAYEKREAPPSP